MRAVPPGFTRTIAEVYGAAGQTWLAGLPSLIAACERRWSLTVSPPFDPLSYNYVAPAVRAGVGDVVLKLGVPNPELLAEIAALRAFDGRGIVRLLKADAEQGVLLLERLAPGTPLSALTDDEAATAIAAQVMRQLWRPAPAQHAFPTVEKWAQGLQRLRARYHGGTGPLAAGLVERAEAVFSELLGSMATPVLLHGDLHHDNILAAQRQPWLALDPKGVVGEPAYEVGALLRNPIPWLLRQPDPAGILARRVDQLADLLGFDRRRLLAWGLAQAVLSAFWSLEDHGHGWEPSMAVAELLDGLVTK